MPLDIAPLKIQWLGGASKIKDMSSTSQNNSSKRDGNRTPQILTHLNESRCSVSIHSRESRQSNAWVGPSKSQPFHVLVVRMGACFQLPNTQMEAVDQRKVNFTYNHLCFWYLQPTPCPYILHLSRIDESLLENIQITWWFKYPALICFNFGTFILGVKVIFFPVCISTSYPTFVGVQHVDQVYAL